MVLVPHRKEKDKKGKKVKKEKGGGEHYLGNNMQGTAKSDNSGLLASQLRTTLGKDNNYIWSK